VWQGLSDDHEDVARFNPEDLEVFQSIEDALNGGPEEMDIDS